MEKALIIGKLSHRVPRNIIEQFKKLKGVSDADMVFGPYDFYIVIKTDSKEMLGDTSLKIRSIKGVLDSQTCYVVSLPEIRPEAKGPFVT